MKPADLWRPGESKGKPSPGPAPDLFTQVDAETWLAERLKAHGCDIYAGGPYETYADRLGACIVRNRMQAVVVGRNPDGRPETYRETWERLYNRSLSDVPRATPIEQSKQSKATL